MSAAKTAVVIVIVLVAVYVGFLLIGSGTIQRAVERAQPPDVEITSRNSRDGFSGFDYVIWVDVSVYNRGGGGTVTIWAEVSQGGGSWSRARSVTLDSRGSADLTLEFREASLFGGLTYTYRVWVEH